MITDCGCSRGTKGCTELFRSYFAVQFFVRFWGTGAAFGSGIPKRTGNGIDFNKIALIVAVLEKRAHLSLGNQDIYLNVVSGMKITEPAVDLGIALVIASSFKNSYISKDMAIIGEVGLTGEIRTVNMIDKRLKEAERLGIKKCIIPENNKKMLKNKYKLEIIGVRNINEALKAIGL